MINNNITANSGKQRSYISYTGQFKQNKSTNNVFQKYVRGRFLQQSASYLGADLSKYETQALCYGYAVNFTNE